MNNNKLLPFLDWYDKEKSKSKNLRYSLTFGPSLWARLVTELWEADNKDFTNETAYFHNRILVYKSRVSSVHLADLFAKYWDWYDTSSNTSRKTNNSVNPRI